MQILVTGAAGFVASRVVPKLLERGDDVVGLDKEPRPAAFAGCPWVRADITELNFPGLVGGPFDRVVHLAAVAAPRECEARPGTAFNVNVRGTYEVLKLAEAWKAKLVLASSAHVYGIPPLHVPTQEDAPLKPQDTYTCSKVSAEDLCRRFFESYNLAYIALRLYNGYGPGQPSGYFIPDMIRQAKVRGEIQVRGATITKDWLYLDDMAEAVVRATQSPFVGALNVGSGQATSLFNVAKHVGARLGVPVQAVDDPSRPPSFMQADLDRVRRMLSWEPKVSLEEGLDLTLAAVPLAGAAHA